MFSPHHPVQLVLGLIIWSLFFVAVYSGLSVGCAFAPPSPEQGALTWINASVLLLMLATMIYLLCNAYYCWRARLPSKSSDNQGQPQKVREFIARIAASEYLLAAVATLLVGLPSVYLPPCV
jgi:cytosine/uracil/thiamine/allantoin permease